MYVQYEVVIIEDVFGTEAFGIYADFTKGPRVFEEIKELLIGFEIAVLGVSVCLLVCVCAHMHMCVYVCTCMHAYTYNHTLIREPHQLLCFPPSKPLAKFHTTMCKDVLHALLSLLTHWQL